MSAPAIHRQARDALLSFDRTARVEGRHCEGFHWLGESPHDAAYRVKLTLSVRYDSASKSYRASLAISEERYEGGFASQRHEFEMPSRQLPSTPATRFSAATVEKVFRSAISALRKDITPLVELLQEESERS